MPAPTPPRPGGPSPRIEPVPPDTWQEIARTLPLTVPGPADAPLNVFTVLARHPELFRTWVGFAGTLLLTGQLPARARELAILRTAHRSACTYEWAHHVPLARAAGLSEEAIASLNSPAPDGRWDGEDLLVLRATDEIHDLGELTDHTWDALRRLYDDRQLIELVILVGQYRMLAATLRTLRVPLED
ncbi:carboxymuconolactone decarboxylase family protein [Kitasatospora sp. NBC_00070]|uniref:carboxymuconolactone decarboxylase family protein n=1 Tax=Kitasatospora sp. NBC_00070 TaxID=2975962 RepID=UPI0032513A3A